MKSHPTSGVGKPVLRVFLRAERGTTLLEIAIVLPIFLLIFFALIDFGRFGAEHVMVE